MTKKANPIFDYVFNQAHSCYFDRISGKSNAFARLQKHLTPKEIFDEVSYQVGWDYESECDWPDDSIDHDEADRLQALCRRIEERDPYDWVEINDEHRKRFAEWQAANKNA